jgi:hypothetical protein
MKNPYSEIVRHFDHPSCMFQKTTIPFTTTQNEPIGEPLIAIKEYQFMFPLDKINEHMIQMQFFVLSEKGQGSLSSFFLDLEYGEKNARRTGSTLRAIV